MSVPSKMLWTPSDILLQNGVNADLDPLYHQLNLIIMVREDTHIKVFFLSVRTTKVRVNPPPPLVERRGARGFGNFFFN